MDEPQFQGTHSWGFWAGSGSCQPVFAWLSPKTFTGWCSPTWCNSVHQVQEDLKPCRTWWGDQQVMVECSPSRWSDDIIESSLQIYIKAFCAPGFLLFPPPRTGKMVKKTHPFPPFKSLAKWVPSLRQLHECLQKQPAEGRIFLAKGKIINLMLLSACLIIFKRLTNVVR